MAIDSEKKRRAARDAGNVIAGPTVVPDGEIDEDDRSQIAGAYALGQLAPADPLPAPTLVFSGMLGELGYDGELATTAVYTGKLAGEIFKDGELHTSLTYRGKVGDIFTDGEL